MVNLSRMPPYIATRLVRFSILPLPDWTFLLSLIKLVNSWLRPLLLTNFLWNGFCDISKALYPMSFKCSSPPRWIFMDILMSTGHLVQMTKKHWWLWHLPWSEFSVMVFQETKGCVSQQCRIWVSCSYVCYFGDYLDSICFIGTLSLSSSPPLLWCDNKSAAHLAANPMFYARTKHIEMDLHFIWDHVLRKQLIIQYLPSSE